MFSEWADLVNTLKDLERRIEILQIQEELEEQSRSLGLQETPSPPAQLNRHYYRWEVLRGLILNTSIKILHGHQIMELDNVHFTFENERGRTGDVYY